MENFIYLIVDKKKNQAAVVDPAWDTDRIIQKAKELKVTITDILLTHSHHDHINGIKDILDYYDAQLHLTNAEYKFWDTELAKPALHYGGDIIQLGSTDIEILATPGHTPGSACYHIDNKLVTGDTMFVYGCGRCDLSGGDPNQMYTTLRKITDSLAGGTITLPGHNYSVVSTCSLEEQKAGNPFLHYDDRDEFVKFRMVSHDQLRHSPYTAITKLEMNQFQK